MVNTPNPQLCVTVNSDGLHLKTATRSTALGHRKQWWSTPQNHKNNNPGSTLNSDDRHFHQLQNEPFLLVGLNNGGWHSYQPLSWVGLSIGDLHSYQLQHNNVRTEENLEQAQPCKGVKPVNGIPTLGHWYLDYRLIQKL